MDIAEFAPTLIQMPIVGLFIWFILKTNKEHKDEREKKDDKFTASVDKSSQAIADLNSTTQQFHTEVKEWRRENRQH